MPLHVATDLVEHIAKASPDATIVLDPHESWPSDRAALSRLAADVDVFAPSLDELTSLMGTDEVDDAAEGLRLLGFAAVVVKLGAQGALVVDGAGSSTRSPRSRPRWWTSPAPVTPSAAPSPDPWPAGCHCATPSSARSARPRGPSRRTDRLPWPAWISDAAVARLAGSPPRPQRTVAVLGSARLGPDDPRWHEARALGAALGAQGWTVMTGGYGGLMAATAQGAHEAGAVVVGLPMTAWADLEPSAYVSELRWSADYAERLTHILGADVVIALPGGIGTLAEATVVWSALQTEPGAARLVLFGDAWQRLVGAFGDELVVGAEDLRLARVALDVESAVAMTEQAYLDTSATAGPRG